MAGSRRRRNRGGISKADPAKQMAMLSQRSFVRARELGREDPVRVAIPLGTLEDGALGHVDPAGLVQLDGREWALDWWIGAEDRWHFASSDPTVVQTLMGSAPVVRTTMHVPGGEIIHRTFGARASAAKVAGAKAADDRTHGEEDLQKWDGGAVVIEVENKSAVPVALAFVVRPITLWGDGRVDELSSEGPVISVDGSPAAVLSRPIARRVVGPPGTVAIRLDLEDDEQPDGVWAVEGQLAEGAFVVPLPHTAVVRVLLPVTNDSTSKRTAPRRGAAPAVGSQWDAPTADQVESGWRAISRKMVSVSSPEPLLDGLVAISPKLLGLVVGEHFFDAVAGYPAAVRNAALCEALVTCGADDALEPLAWALADSERLSGAIRMPDRSDASVALLHCAAPLMSGQRSERWTELLLGPVAKAVHRLERGRGLGTKSSGTDPFAVYALGRSASLAVARLSPALASIGQPELAEATHSLYHRLADRAEALRRDLSPESSSSESTNGDDAADSSIWRALRLRELVADRSPGAADVLMEFGALGHLGMLPVAIDKDGASSGSHAIDPAAMALRLSVLIDFFVTETPLSLAVVPSWSELWFEKKIEINNVRTSWGVMSYALRWHGNRPILLWEVEPHKGVDAQALEPVLTSPVLDPAWHAHGWSGEALLAPVEISQESRDRIAERDRPRMAVSLGAKKSRSSR